MAKLYQLRKPILLPNYNFYPVTGGKKRKKKNVISALVLQTKHNTCDSVISTEDQPLTNISITCKCIYYLFTLQQPSFYQTQIEDSEQPFTQKQILLYRIIITLVLI